MISITITVRDLCALIYGENSLVRFSALSNLQQPLTTVQDGRKAANRKTGPRRSLQISGGNAPAAPDAASGRSEGMNLSRIR